jgi:hypothetical protein
MYLDAFTLSALVDEFLDKLVGGRVQDSLDVDETGLGLEIYSQHRRHYLYMSADHQTPRVHLVEDKLRRGLPKPKPIGLLMSANRNGSASSTLMSRGRKVKSRSLSSRWSAAAISCWCRRASSSNVSAAWGRMKIVIA